MSLEPFVLPVLWSNTAGVILLKMGTFYNSIYGQLNWALGYTFEMLARNGVGFNVITFYITSWNYDNLGVPNIIGNDTLVMIQYPTRALPVAASVTLPVVMGESASYTDSGDIGIEYGNTVTPIGSVTFGYSTGETIQNVVTGIVSAINAASLTFTATASADGLSVILTANTPGAAGNEIFVQDLSQSGTAGNTPAFYFPISPEGSGKFTYLQGGEDEQTTAAPVTSGASTVSTTDVGGTLYISGFFNYPWVLKYSGPGLFTTSSTYQGVRVLRKFAGSLIGIGVLPQLLAALQDQDMIFAWTSAEDLDEWSPENAAGNVTGAGFEQLADIGESLTGLIVSNNTAYIIRAEGLSYASALGSGQQPFQVAHIGLGPTGEGCQIPSLVGQYDQTGIYVGNSNIFQLSGSIGAIGDKIKSVLIPLLASNQAIAKLVVFPAINEGGDAYPLLMIIIETSIFFYNTMNQCWMMFYPNLPGGFDPTTDLLSLDVLFLVGASQQQFKQFPGVLSYQIGTEQPVAFFLREGIPDTASISGSLCYVDFPQEEIMFGREVSIDAIYISLWADIEEDVVLSFSFNGVHFGSLTLAVGSPNNTLEGQPQTLQVFPDFTVLPVNGMFTSQSPQLRISTNAVVDDNVNMVRIAKIQEYASFDPKQRPV